MQIHIKNVGHRWRKFQQTDATTFYFIGNGAHVCWIEKKYMVIHMYGKTLNTGQSFDQYYYSNSYQNGVLRELFDV